MKTLTFTPGQPGGVAVVDTASPKPGGDELLIQVMAVGICGTDREVANGTLDGAGRASDGNPLVMGHEWVGRVLEPTSSAWSNALVTGRGRRPCGECESCDAGFSDACTTDGWTERGLAGAHGYGAEYVVESPDNLVRLEPSLGILGVLVEPLAVATRAVRHSRYVNDRHAHPVRRAGVFGAGALGMLASYVLQESGTDVTLISRSDEDSFAANFVRSIGGTYLTLADAGKTAYDLTISAAPAAEIALLAVMQTNPNGITCLIGIDGHGGSVSLPREVLGATLVTKNQSVIGSSNATLQDWQAAAAMLARTTMERRELLKSLLAIYSVGDLATAMGSQATKAVIKF